MLPPPPPLLRPPDLASASSASSALKNDSQYHMWLPAKTTVDGNEHTYYFNPATKVSVWECPGVELSRLGEEPRSDSGHMKAPSHTSHFKQTNVLHAFSTIRSAVQAGNACNQGTRSEFPSIVVSRRIYDAFLYQNSVLIGLI